MSLYIPRASTVDGKHCTASGATILPARAKPWGFPRREFSSSRISSERSKGLQSSPESMRALAKEHTYDRTRTD
jgi:hypothetical protein